MRNTLHPAVTVVGAGAIGQTIAAALGAAGETVNIITRSTKTVERIRSYGISVIPDGIPLPPQFIPVSNNSADVASADLVLLCVKCYDTVTAVQSIAGYLSEGTPLLVIQNGIGGCEHAAACYSRENVFRGIVGYGAFVDRYHSIEQYGAPALTVTPCLGSQSSPPVNIQSLGGVQISLSNDGDSLVWSKLVMNCGINPVTAIFAIKNGQLPTTPAAWELALAASREACLVVKAANIRLNFTDPEQELRRVCRMTSGNNSSMLQDVTNGRKTEIDYINGSIIKAAEQCGVSVPINTELRERIITRTEGFQDSPQ